MHSHRQPCSLLALDRNTSTIKYEFLFYMIRHRISSIIFLYFFFFFRSYDTSCFTIARNFQYIVSDHLAIWQKIQSIFPPKRYLNFSFLRRVLYFQQLLLRSHLKLLFFLLNLRYNNERNR